MSDINQIEEKKEFQKFTQFQSSVFVSNKIDLKDVRCVNKYLKFDYFVDSIIHQYFHMSSPSRWDDLFETKYLDFLNSDFMAKEHPQDLEELKSMSIFCTCMTCNNSDNEEASWKNYDTDREQIIRVTYDFNGLCTILSKAAIGKIYVGRMDYRSRKDILDPIPIINNGYEKMKDENNLDVLYVNNFCLKQDAYKYENELRFCIIKRGDEFKQLKSNRIKNVNLTSAIKQITLPPITPKNQSSEEYQTKLFAQIKKALLLKAICPKVPVHVSNLYNTNEEEMTSEFTFI